MRYIATVFLFLIFLSALTGCSASSEGRGSALVMDAEECKEKENSTFLFIDSNACDCVLTACLEYEKEVRAFIEAKGLKETFHVIDVSVSDTSAGDLMEEYSLYPVPALISFGKNCAVLFKEAGHIDLDKLAKSFEEIE